MKVIPFLFAAMLPGISEANVHSMNISDAIKNKVVKVNGVNFNGSYTGRSVKLTVANLKRDSLDLTIDLGVILKPDDTSYQPMVLAGEENLALGPNEKGVVDVIVFCGNGPRHCPKKDLHYTFLKKGSHELISVLRYINNHKLFDFLGQRAVWAITNYHSLTDIYDPERDSLAKKLIDTICLVTGRAKPDYYTITAKTEIPGEAAYAPKTLKIVVPFKVLLKTPTILTAGVYDERDHMIETIIERQLFGKGMHNLDLTFDAEAYGAGKFSIRIMDSQRMLQEKKVVAEE
jgi:hypothetical protein